MSACDWSKEEWGNSDKAIEGLKSLVRDVPDFPKKGILFK